MAEITQAPKWVRPVDRQRAILRARDRANAVKWDLDTAVFLFGIVAIVVILALEEINIWVTAPVAVFGLAMVWLVGWRRSRQAYARFLDEELAQLHDDWRDYYTILRIRPNAEAETVAEAYERISRIYREEPPDETEDLPLYTLRLEEITEAYKVLSEPSNRAAYDQIYWLKNNIAGIGIDEATRHELINLSQSISQKVSETRRRIVWKIPLLDKIPRQAVLAAIIGLLVIFLGGTSFAFAKPGHALAAPFRGTAIGLTKASASIAGLIENIRGITAMFERKVVSTALQSMRVERNLKSIPQVTVPTNDMATFPSPEYPLSPDYLEQRFSQFRYTVDRLGVVTIDTSWATTDIFLEKINRLLDRLEKGE